MEAPQRWQAHCGTCAARVWWALDPGGRLVPTDAPGPDGAMAIHRLPEGDLVCRRLGEGENPRVGEQRAPSHWDTCAGAPAEQPSKRKGGNR